MPCHLRLFFFYFFLLFCERFVFGHCKSRAKNVAECVKSAVIKQIIAVELDKHTAMLIDKIDLFYYLFHYSMKRNDHEHPSRQSAIELQMHDEWKGKKKKKRTI